MNTTEKEKRLKSLQEKINIIFTDCDSAKIVKKALSMKPDDIIREISDSGLRGRGGAGFPTGIKWKGAAEAAGDRKYVICNADEGEPGTFKDRRILEEHPEKVIAGMAVCARAIGAQKGIMYLRGEYRFMISWLQAVIDEYNKIFGQANFNFQIALHMGSGAYVCGEETALMESLEGNRGEPRNKPPFPVTEGYNDSPTIINNVETLAYAAMIIHDGAKKFKSLGTKDSAGGKVFSVSGDTGINGVYELPLGMTIAEFVDLFGDGDTKAVQVGGSSGKCVPRKHFENTIIGFEGVPTGGSMMLFNSSRSMYHVLKNYLEFFQEESCGQCTPCRAGCRQLLKGIEAIRSGEKSRSYIKELQKLASTMAVSSKCGLGQSVANPFNSIVENYLDEICY